MAAFMEELSNNPIWAAALGGTFVFSLVFGLIQRNRYKNEHALPFWPGAFAIGFLWAYLFIGFSILENLPNFAYKTPMFIIAEVWACVVLVVLWVYNYKRLHSISQTLLLIGKQLVASICAAPAIILLPIVLIAAISSVADHSRQRRKLSRNSH